MNIILAVDAIKSPLTGVGRYTWELAARLPLIQRDGEVRFFSRGQWVKDIDTLIDHPSTTAYAQHWLKRSNLAVASYRLLSPIFLRQRLRAFADHLYHSPNFYLPPFAGPSIATIHDLSVFRYPEFHPPERVSYMEKEIPLALKRANFLFTDSQFIRQEIIDYFGWPENKVCVIPLGASDEYRPRGINETTGILNKYDLKFHSYTLFVATIEPRKNLTKLIAAYAALPAKLRNQYPLVLVGDHGWRSKSIYQQIDQGQRQGWLYYLGYVSEVDLPFIFSGARGFVYPSLYEGFGLPVLEAMSSGLPVLISNRASLPEIAMGAAAVVEANDLQEMTEGIRILLEDDQWRALASKNSLKVAAQYSWETTARKTFEAYCSVYNDFFGIEK